MRHRPGIRIVHCYSCRYAALRTVDRPKALCASASFSVGVTGLPRRSQVWWTKGRETRRSGGLPQAPSQVYSSGRPFPDGRDETTWKMGNCGLDAIRLCPSSMHRCYPARSDIRTSTRHKQIRETTTGEVERAKVQPTCRQAS